MIAEAGLGAPKEALVPAPSHAQMESQIAKSAANLVLTIVNSRLGLLLIGPSGTDVYGYQSFLSSGPYVNRPPAEHQIVDPLADRFALVEAQQGSIDFGLLVVVLVVSAMLVSAIGSGVTLRRFLRV